MKSCLWEFLRTKRRLVSMTLIFLAITAVRDVLCNECSACLPPIKENFVMVPYGHADTYVTANLQSAFTENHRWSYKLVVWLSVGTLTIGIICGLPSKNKLVIFGGIYSLLTFVKLLWHHIMITIASMLHNLFIFLLYNQELNINKNNLRFFSIFLEHFWVLVFVIPNWFCTWGWEWRRGGGNFS